MTAADVDDDFAHDGSAAEGNDGATKLITRTECHGGIVAWNWADFKFGRAATTGLSRSGVGEGVHFGWRLRMEALKIFFDKDF